MKCLSKEVGGGRDRELEKREGRYLNWTETAVILKPHISKVAFTDETMLKRL